MNRRGNHSTEIFNSSIRQIPTSNHISISVRIIVVRVREHNFQKVSYKFVSYKNKMLSQKMSTETKWYEVG